MEKPPIEKIFYEQNQDDFSSLSFKGGREKKSRIFSEIQDTGYQTLTDVIHK